jgi:hypothetical protein
MVGLSKDKDGIYMYDFGKEGKHFIEIINEYENGIYKRSIISPIYLIYKGKFKEIEVEIVNKGEAEVKISFDRKVYDKKLKLTDIEGKGSKKIYFQVEKGKKPKFEIILKSIEIEEE